MYFIAKAYQFPEYSVKVFKKFNVVNINMNIYNMNFKIILNPHKLLPHIFDFTVFM